MTILELLKLAPGLSSEMTFNGEKIEKDGSKIASEDLSEVLFGEMNVMQWPDSSNRKDSKVIAIKM